MLDNCAILIFDYAILIRYRNRFFANFLRGKKEFNSFPYICIYFFIDSLIISTDYFTFFEHSISPIIDPNFFFFNISSNNICLSLQRNFLIICQKSNIIKIIEIRNLKVLKNFS